MLLSQSVRVVGVVRVVSEICFLISTSAAMPPWISFFKFFKNTRTDRTLLIVSGFDKREERDTGSISLLSLYFFFEQQ